MYIHYSSAQGLWLKTYAKKEMKCKTYTETTLKDEEMIQFCIFYSMVSLSHADSINKGKTY